MAEREKRFQLLLTEREFELLKKESKKRNISSGELIRESINKELAQKTNLEQIQSIQELSKIIP